MRVIVDIDVPELAPAIEFYCSALGLELGRVLDGDVAELLGASSRIYLLQNPAGTPTAGFTPSGFFHFRRRTTRADV